MSQSHVVLRPAGFYLSGATWFSAWRISPPHINFVATRISPLISTLQLRSWRMYLLPCESSYVPGAYLPSCLHVPMRLAHISPFRRHEAMRLAHAPPSCAVKLSAWRISLPMCRVVLRMAHISALMCRVAMRVAHISALTCHIRMRVARIPPIMCHVAMWLLAKSPLTCKPLTPYQTVHTES